MTVVYLERVAAGIQALAPAVLEVVRVAPLLCHSDTKVGRKGATKVGAKSAPDAAAPRRRDTSSRARAAPIRAHSYALRRRMCCRLHTCMCPACSQSALSGALKEGR